MGAVEGVVVVSGGRAKPLWRGHPWVFADSIERIEGSPEPGALVQVTDGSGRAIGCGLLSPRSAIAVRMLARTPGIDDLAGLLRERLLQAVALRHETLQLPVFTDAYRLVHSEGDALPGLVVDHFAGHLVVQLSTAGMWRQRETVLDLLEEIVSPRSIHLRSDRRACAIEEIPAEEGLARGREPSAPPEISEHGVCFRVALGAGQKTGFFCDQRFNRHYLARLVRDRTVLDLHTYVGGFALHAAVNGAREVWGIDTSGPALALAAENAMLNNGRQVRFERADARALLDDLHGKARRFDVVVSDPPPFARDRAQVRAALRAYKDLHLRAMRVVAPGGLLAVSSCSGSVDEATFERTVREAAYDLGRELRVLYRGGQAPDHPVSITCPEGRYLKFLLASLP